MGDLMLAFWTWLLNVIQTPLTYLAVIKLNIIENPTGGDNYQHGHYNSYSNPLSADILTI